MPALVCARSVEGCFAEELAGFSSKGTQSNSPRSWLGVQFADHPGSPKPTIQPGSRPKLARRRCRKTGSTGLSRAFATCVFWITRSRVLEAPHGEQGSLVSESLPRGTSSSVLVGRWHEVWQMPAPNLTGGVDHQAAVALLGGLRIFLRAIPKPETGALAPELWGLGFRV